jgi:hypothetical protein
MKSSGTLPAGFICNCGKDHPFHVWVYAHWQEPLFLKCDCGREFEFEAGRIYEIITPKGLVKNAKIVPYKTKSSSPAV